MHPIELQYSEEIVRLAVKEFCKRSIGMGLPIAFGLMLIFFIYLLWTGNSSWLTGAVGSVLAFALIMVITLYVAHYRSAMQRLRAMHKPTAILELSSDSLAIKADSGSSEIPSTSITEVWAYEDFWLVFLSRAQFFTIPLANLDSDAQAKIRSTFDGWGLRVS